MVKKSQNPVAQILRRLEETHGFVELKSTSKLGLKKEHTDGPVWSGFAMSQQQYKQFSSESVFLSIETGNKLHSYR